MLNLESGNTFKYTCFTIFTSVSFYTTTSVAIYTICARSAVFTWIGIALINICKHESGAIMITNVKKMFKCEHF